MRDAMQMMRRRSVTSVGGRSNRPSMSLRRRRMVHLGNLERRPSCGKVRHTQLEYLLWVTEDLFCLGIEMVLNHNLTLSNDTIAMYVTQRISSPACAPSPMLMLYIARVWISSSHVAAVAAKGFHIVHAASDSFYLVRVSILSNHLSDLTNPSALLDGTGLRRRRLDGKQSHRQQLV
jgi:hypothetical protein